MKILSMHDFSNGWIIGNFSPSLFHSGDFEVALKSFKKLDTEPNHFQQVATEASVVISGQIRMGEYFLKPGQILVVEPGETCDFEALEDSTVLAIKWPSIPGDKIIVE
jgi:quercetin dioxygenase-like cupin family protein